MSKVDLVYQFVLNEIASKNYKNGDHLVISKIAEVCHVSDIPVREALRNLQRDGYVSITQNQGAVVVGISKEAIENIVQVKGVLEAYATRLSIDFLSQNDLKNLHAINEELKVAIENNDSAAASELNQKFHMSIYSHLPNKELIDMIRGLWEKWSFTKKIFSFSPAVRSVSFTEHEALLRLLQDRKYAETEAFVREHKFKTADKWEE